MPAPRNYTGLVDGTEGIGYSRTSAPGYNAVRLVSALDLACPTCSAGIGEDCTTGRKSTGKHPVPLLCPARMAAALQRMRSGETEEVVPARPRDAVFNPGPKQQHKKLADQARAEIVRKHKAGARYAELSREYSVAPTSIKYVLVKAGALNS